MATHPRGFDGEQFVNHLLDRIEQNAVGSAKRFRMFQEAHKQRLLNGEALAAERIKSQTREADMKLALAKIAEWEAYAEKLRDIIWAGAVPAEKRPDFPDVPNALEFPIPF